MTVASTVAEAARRFGERGAFVSADGWTLSYGDLDRLSNEVAVGLAQRFGIGEGDVVALVLPSTPDFVVAYAALAKLGAITVGINPRYAPPERAALVAKAAPTLVLATPELAHPLELRQEGAAQPFLADKVGGDLGVRGVEVEVAGGSEGILAGLRVAAVAPPVLDGPDDPERVVAIVFTSGTTGEPKGAVFGNRELAAVTHADLGQRAEEWGGGGAALAGTEFAHVGFMTKLPTMLRTGSTTHLLQRWRASDVLGLIAEHRIEVLGGVAPQMALLLGHPDIDRFDVSSVKAIVMGGAASPAALVDDARRRFGAPYSIRYSSTESGGIGLGTAFDADDDEALNTVGRPRAGVSVEVRDDQDRPAPIGEVGELVLRSPTMMRGYWQDPEGTASALRGGWLRTGDLAFLDDRGLVHLAGRSKEMYIRGGYNVYPQQVEAALASHPAIAAVVVVPRPDPVMGEVGVAVVVPVDAGRPPTLASLCDALDGVLARFKHPEALHLVDELPLTAMQKVDRAALATQVAPPPTPGPPPDPA